MKATVFCIALAGAWVLAPALSAQQPEEADQPKPPVVLAPPAPVPAQIVTAKKVFISNPGDSVALETGFKYAGGNNRTYNEFYAAMKDRGPYELVSAPADADLILEIHFNVSASADRHSYFQLLILDPKTHVLLWGFHEPVKSSGGFGWKEKQERNFNLAVANLADEIKKLVALPLTTSANSGK